MNLLQDAALENQQGMRLLRSGDSTGAMLSFQSAVALLKDAAVEHAENPCEILRTYSSRDGSTLARLRAQEQQDRQQQEEDGSVRPTGRPNDVSYVYNRPFRIPSAPEIQSHEDLEAFILMSSTFLIFNFALACHEHGSVSRSEQYLVRAAGLYRLALKSLASSAEGMPANNPMFPVLQCLALNNLANLHFERCDFCKSQGCLDLMYQIVISTDCLDLYLNPKEIEELMLNMVHMQPPVVAHAA